MWRQFDFNLKRRTLTYITFVLYLGITYQSAGIIPTSLLMSNYSYVLDCSHATVLCAECIPSITSYIFLAKQRIKKYWTGVSPGDGVEMYAMKQCEEEHDEELSEWTSIKTV